MTDRTAEESLAIVRELNDQLHKVIAGICEERATAYEQRDEYQRLWAQDRRELDAARREVALLKQRIASLHQCVFTFDAGKLRPCHVCGAEAPAGYRGHAQEVCDG